VRFIPYGTERRLAPERELNTYRILRELLTNALKHAQATAITVQLIFYADFLYASVEDDGKGIDQRTQPRGIGLKNIQLRADFLSATLTTESGPSGTLIALEVPYSE
jgi:signal transduction histidine kinase